MYQILQGLASFMMIFGGVLVVLGLISLPFEHKYKKKHGPMPGDTRAILYAGLAAASLLIAVPLKVFVFKPRRPAIHNINFSNLQPGREAQKKQALKGAIDSMNRQLDKELGIRRVKLTPEEAERRRELEAQQDAERERSRQEGKERQAAMRREMEARQAADRERHQQKMQEARDRHAAIRREMEETREMRKADFFRPPEGSTTPAQKALDEKVVTLNAELQDLKADKERLDQEAASASEAYRDMIKSGVADQAKLTELRTRSSETRKAAFDTGRAVTEKRSEVTRVLQERYRLVE